VTVKVPGRPYPVLVGQGALLELLRRAWINVDLVWTWALIAAGTSLLLVSFAAV